VLSATGAKKALSREPKKQLSIKTPDQITDKDLTRLSISFAFGT
jgi:hypothetical protein